MRSLRVVFFLVLVLGRLFSPPLGARVSACPLPATFTHSNPSHHPHGESQSHIHSRFRDTPLLPLPIETKCAPSPALDGLALDCNGIYAIPILSAVSFGSTFLTHTMHTRGIKKGKRKGQTPSRSKKGGKNRRHGALTTPVSYQNESPLPSHPQKAPASPPPPPPSSSKTRLHGVPAIRR